MLSDEELYDRLQPYIPAALDRERVRKIIPVLKDRLTRLGEFVELTGFFFGPPPDYDASLLVPKKGTPETAREALTRVRALLANLPEPWTHEEWEAQMRALAAELDTKAGDLFMVLRVAVTGSMVSPPLYESMEILGNDEVLVRVDAALAKIS
jgi:glutamyl-tRNA synthetase